MTSPLAVFEIRRRVVAGDSRSPRSAVEWPRTILGLREPPEAGLFQFSVLLEPRTRGSWSISVLLEPETVQFDCRRFYQNRKRVARGRFRFCQNPKLKKTDLLRFK